MTRPVVLDVFHGTRAEFSTFKPSARGTFGPGIYFGSTLQQGAIFSGEADDSVVLKVRVTLQRPYHHRIVEPVEVDSWGEGLVNEILGPKDAARVLKAAAEGDGHFGSELYEALEAMGHDGIVADYGDGTQEIVAFHEGQCEILGRLTLDEAYACGVERQRG